MKKMLLSAAMLVSGAAVAQVGIKTPNPKAILDVKGTNYDPTGTSNDEGKATLRVDGNTNHSLDVGTFASDPFGAYLQSKEKSRGTGLPLILNPIGGNVGIKTTNPTQLLDVNGKTRVRTLDNASKTDNVMFSTSEGVLEKSDITYEQLNKVITLPISNPWNLTGNNNAVQDASFLGTTNAVDLDVKTNNIQRIRIKADNGNVGIKTTNPTELLDVNGKTRVRTLDNASKTDNVMFSTSEGVLEKSDITYEQLNRVITLPTSNPWSLTGNNNAVQGTSFLGTTNAVDLDVKTNNIQRIRIKADNGKVGIGTINPEGNLHVVGNNYDPKSSDEGTPGNYATFRIDGGTNHSLDMGTVASGPYGSYLQSHNKGGAGGLPFAINPNGGRVGINTLKPQENMDVNGGIQLRNNIRLGGSDTSQGNAGTKEQILTSQGENQPGKWMNLRDMKDYIDLLERITKLETKTDDRAPVYAFAEDHTDQLILINTSHPNAFPTTIVESSAGVMDNGVFTAPIKGTYIVSSRVPWLQSAPGSADGGVRTKIHLIVNDQEIMAYESGTVLKSHFNNIGETTFSRMIILNAGDKVRLSVSVAAIYNVAYINYKNLKDQGYPYFSIVKVN